MDNDNIGSEEAALYKKNALTAVSFIIVYNKDEYEKKIYQEFKPDMAHQIFGESETIYGYRSLSIQLFFPHNSLRCFVDVQASGKIENSEVEPDDIMGCLEPWLQDYTTEEKTFLKDLENEKHDQLFGTVLDTFELSNENESAESQLAKRTYKICLCDLQDDHFREYHKRFETFIIWFIDAANFIDTEDDRWMIFYIYEEFEHPEEKSTYISPIGFCSVYKFYAYPEHIRPRISQFFILPTYQRKGLGRKLYHTVVDHIRGMSNIVDITVEEPTDTFQRIRDIDDCLELKKKFEEANIRVIRDNQKNVLNVMKSMKICKRQIQRLLDILCCLDASKSGNIAYQTHLNSIKKRLKSEMERQTRGSKRINTEAMDAMMEPIDKTTLLDANFKKYISDIGPSVKYLQKILETNSKDL